MMHAEAESKKHKMEHFRLRDLNPRPRGWPRYHFTTFAVTQIGASLTRGVGTNFVWIFFSNLLGRQKDPRLINYPKTWILSCQNCWEVDWTLTTTHHMLSKAELRQHKREREKDILKLKKRMNKFLEAKSCHRERQTVWPDWAIFCNYLGTNFITKDVQMFGYFLVSCENHNFLSQTGEANFWATFVKTWASFLFQNLVTLQTKERKDIINSENGFDAQNTEWTNLVPGPWWWSSG